MYSEFMGTLKGRMYLEPLGSKCSRVQLHEDKWGGGSSVIREIWGLRRTRGRLRLGHAHANAHRIYICKRTWYPLNEGTEYGKKYSKLGW